MVSGCVCTVSSSKAERSGMMLECWTTSGEGLSGTEEDEKEGEEEEETAGSREVCKSCFSARGGGMVTGLETSTTGMVSRAVCES